MKKPPLLLTDDLPPLLPTCVHYAGTARYIEKALELQRGAGEKFDICCDLEDGAVVGEERKLLQSFIEIIAARTPAEGRIGVRVHPIASRLWEEEIDHLIKKVGRCLGFIVLPKAANAEEVSKVLRWIAARSKAQKLKKPVPLQVIIESRSAVADVRAIAALDSVETLDFGLLDFISDHGGVIPEECMHSPAQFEHRIVARAKDEIVAASLLHSKVPAHNVCINLKTTAQVFEDALRARQKFGFLRMWSIHPAQIEPIQRAMRPDFSKLAEARDILEQAEAAKWAPIRFNERLYDRASYRSCYELVRRAGFYGVR